MSDTIRAFVIEADSDHARDGQLVVNGQLEALQNIVGGWVEVVTSSDGQVTFWMNDEGKIANLPLNGLATAFWWSVCPEAVNVDTLHGNIVVTGGVDENGATLGVPDEMANTMLNIYVEDDE